MYHDLKALCWWPGMKKDVVEFVAKCLTCQQVKAEHQRPAGLLQPLKLPEWKWEEISMDFVSGLPKTTKQHDAIWVVVDRHTKSAHFLPVRMTYSMDQFAELYVNEIVRLHGALKAYRERWELKIEVQYCISSRDRWSPLHWDELGENKLLGPDAVQHTNEAIQKIRARMITAQSRQKSYADLKRRDIEFEEDLSYNERPVKILDQKDRILRNKTITLVKVLWRNSVVEEATWELESDMREQYPE
ncbi:hypothetical protein CsatA_010569 [Cannabis sativa]